MVKDLIQSGRRYRDQLARRSRAAKIGCAALLVRPGHAVQNEGVRYGRAGFKTNGIVQVCEGRCHGNLF